MVAANKGSRGLPSERVAENLVLLGGRCSTTEHKQVFIAGDTHQARGKTFGPARELPATGRTVSVPHMHFVRMINGKATDLWHLWDTSQMLGQLGITPEPR